MKNKLDGKIAVISGASSGIGKAIATALQKEGAKIVDISLKTDGSYFKNYAADITDNNAVAEIVTELQRDCGKIDFLFCNAGFGIGGSMENTRLGDIEKLFAVNLVSHVKMTVQMLPLINNGGKIFFTGSLASIIPLPYQACYSASKAAIENFARALRTELKPRKIAVCTIMPGDIRTGFTDARVKTSANTDAENHSIAKMEKAERSGKSPDTVAKVAVALAKRKNPPLRVSVGAGSKAIALLVKLLPLRTVNFLVEKLYI